MVGANKNTFPVECPTDLKSVKVTDNYLDRIKQERYFHESEDLLRNENSFINDVYGSGLFDEAEEFLLSAIGDIQGARALDFGCGDGRGMAHLKERGACVTGFDISLSRLILAQDRLAPAGAEVCANLVQCPAERLPFSDNSFDAIYGKQVLHHLDWESAIEEIARVLRPGGRAVFLEPLIHNPLLEGYRRLTPQLRSPKEKALSMDDLDRLGNYFSDWEHREFCLFSVLPALAASLAGQSSGFGRVRRQLEKIDRWLLTHASVLGRYCWETVIILYR